MILDSLNNTAQVENLHPLFKKVFDYILTIDFSKVPVGILEVKDEKFKITVAEIIGKHPSEANLETHTQYIDIQIPISGTERMGWRAVGDCKELISPYNSEKDLAFYKDQPSTYIDVAVGNFIIFFPQDAHAPGIASGTLKKVVVKIPVK